MGRLKIGGSASHSFMGRAYGGLGGAASSSASAFEVSVDSIVASEKAGLDWVLCADATDYAMPVSAFTPDLSSAAGKTYPNWNAVFMSEPIITAAAARTKNIRMVHGPVDSVRRAPVNIAQMALTLDHATQGRSGLLMSVGQQNHIRPYGVSRQGAEDKFWDCFQIVRRMLDSTEPFSFHGRVWKMDRAALALPFYGDKPPPLYIEGATPDLLELAGRFADGWHHYLPSWDDDDVAIFADRVATVRKHAKAVGRNPDDIAISVSIETVSSTDGALLKRALVHPYVLWGAAFIMPLSSAVFQKWGLPHPAGYDYNYYRDSIPEWVSRQEFDDLVSRIPKESVARVFYTGTTDEVWARLQPFLKHHVTEVRILNWASMCGPEFVPGAAAANASLAEKLRTV